MPHADRQPPIGDENKKMINPKNPSDVKRLAEAVEYSRRKLEPFRSARVSALKQYVGRHYSENGSTDKVPVNLLELAINIYVQQLAANSPQVLVNTPHMEIKPNAYKLELGTNKLIRDINLEETLQMAVIEAMFGIGIVKTGINRAGQIEIDGFTHDIGEPYADIVHLDDWVHDAIARTYEQVGFCGNRYRLPYDHVMESKSYKTDDSVKPTDNGFARNEGGDERGEAISRGTDSPVEYLPMIELWDIWLPDEKLLCTFPAAPDGSIMNWKKPMQIIEWSGPQKGPYHLLSFSPVPGNIMPLPPVALWMDLHKLTNKLFRKCGDQADRQKTLLGIQAGAEKDGQRIVDGRDGDTIRMDNPAGAKEFKFGGVAQETLAFCIHLKDLYSYMAGNLDALGGLSPQADTLGQDQLLSASASKRMASMSAKTLNFAQEVTSDLAWYLWHDPVIDLPLTMPVEGTDIVIPTSFGPHERISDFFDFNLEVEPYSMQHQSPQMRLQSLTNVFNTFIAPFAQILAEQGITVNFQKVMSIISRYGNMPELNEILITQEPLSPEGPVGTPPEKFRAPMSPVTNRTYTRINRPGATSQGKNQALINTLLGNRMQSAETNQIGRPTG